jgi:hypothetical protein
MASLDATDINSLPMGGTDIPPNIVLQKNEKIDSLEQINQMRENDLKQMQQTNQNAAMPSAMEQSTMNSLISGIQHASASGLTKLPSRDIPQTTFGHTQDQQIKPNYVPQSGDDYIAQQQSKDEIMRHHMRKQNKQDTLDIMYDEFQIPILIGILYFMFQLPIVRSYLFKYLPTLYNKDGNPKLQGYVINSILFASMFYIIKSSLNYLTQSI